MSLKKITISELSIGMFVHEMDIPWIKSPFLRHKRKIASKNDILLLKKAGVKNIIIDLSRGSDIKTDNDIETPKPNDKQADDSEEIAGNESTDAPVQSDVKTELNTEIEVAKVLQNKIGKLVDELANLVKQGRPLSADEINPVIDEAKDSLNRNDQALLTMLHLHRQDIKLSDHGFGVFSVVLPLAIRLECSEQEVNQLGMAALLHDTGWSRLPMHLMGKNKPLHHNILP